MRILRQDLAKVMWANKSLWKIWNASELRKFSCGSGILLSSILLTNQPGQDEQKKPWTIEYPKAAKKNDIVSDLDKTGLNLRLYQYQTCPYCCKVRAFLDYYGFSYEVVEVNPVPILTSVCCDKPLVDSSVIISVLSTFLHQKQIEMNNVLDLYPSHIGEDERTKKPMSVTPNKFYVMREDSQVKSQSELQSIRHNITDERQAMLDAFNRFLEAKGDSRRFMGGDQPNLGDLALYGAINSFAGCRTFKEMRKQVPNLNQWYEDVQQAVLERKGSNLIREKTNLLIKN